MSINVYVQEYVGEGTPFCVHVWKMPPTPDATQAGKVAKAMSQCCDKAPKRITREAVKHFNAIIGEISDISPALRDVLCDYIFLGNTTSGEKAK